MELKKNWGDHKNSISPFIELPEFGTTLEVFDADGGNKLFEVLWTGSSFKLKELGDW